LTNTGYEDNSFTDLAEKMKGKEKEGRAGKKNPDNGVFGCWGGVPYFH
jgi:hypothetical protein